MPRFFAEKENIGSEEIVLTGQDVKHIRQVLRMKSGDSLTVSDGCGQDYYCAVEDYEDDSVRLRIIDSWRSYTELPVQITLFQGYPKGEKMDFIVQKAVELGAHDIVPMMTERTIVRLDDKKAGKKTARLNEISRSAAKQAGRARIPVVHSPVSFHEAVAMAKSLDAVVMPYEKAEGMEKSREIVKSLAGIQSAGLFIGPEGGFSREEVEEAVSAGAKTISLGNRILRTETAGMAVLSILMFALEKDR